jgi:hypothetical protein
MFFDPTSSFCCLISENRNPSLNIITSFRKIYKKFHLLNIRTKFYFFILIIIAISEIKSQEINPLDFFPYHVGDIWQYTTYTQTGSEFWEKKITAIDTVWADSSIVITEWIRNSYAILNKMYFSDSLVVYWESWGDPTWSPRYKFGDSINSFWLTDTYFPWYAKYVDEYYDVVFDDTLVTREYWFEGDTVFNLPLWIEHLAIGIGLYLSEFEIGLTVLNGCIINGVQYGIINNFDEQTTQIQLDEYLLNNHPNPFNNQTKINFFTPISTYINITIIDILGREVEKVVEGDVSAGHHYQTWQPDLESSGIYFVVLRTDRTQLIHKILYLK